MNTSKNSDNTNPKIKEFRMKEFKREHFIKMLHSNGFKLFGIFCLVIILMTVSYQTRTGAVDFEGSFTCNINQLFNEQQMCGLSQNIERSVFNQIQQQILDEVRSQYPNLNQNFLAQEVEKRFREVLETRSYKGQDIDNLVALQFTQYTSQFQSDSNQTYLTAIDPYYYLGLSTNYYQNGHVGTTLDEYGNSVVEYRLAPNGINSTKLDLHTFILAQMYGLYGIDKENPSKTEQIGAIFTLSALIATLVVLPTFFLIKQVTNTPFAFIGTLLLMTSTVFVSRTQAGFVDTDAYNVLFPLLITALLYVALKTKYFTLKIGYSTLAGISMGLFVFAWSSSWFFALFSLLALCAPLFSQTIQVLFDILSNNSSQTHLKAKSTATSKKSISKAKSTSKKKAERRSEIKSQENTTSHLQSLQSLFTLSYLKEKTDSLIVFLTYFIVAQLVSLSLTKRELLTTIFNGITSASRLTSVSSDNMWPNVLSSVAELNSASINAIFSNLISNTSYGQLFTIIGLAGVVMYLVSTKSAESLLENIFSKIHTTITKDISHLLFGGLSIVYFTIIILFFKSLTVNSAALFLFLLSLPILIALFFALYNREIPSYNAFFVSITLIWFLGAMYMSLNGTRFILLLVPAFALLFSFGWFHFLNVAIKLLQLEFKSIKTEQFRASLSIVTCVIVYLLMSSQIQGAYTITSSSTPNFDDSWYELMEFAQTNTSENAIFNSWWDFGHFFAAIGDRGVTFDGASQATPASYWVGHWLMQNDEEVAVDVLRMLSCSGNNGYEYTNALFNNSASGVHAFNLINDVMGKNKSEKIQYLENYSHFSFTTEHIDTLVNTIHCKEPNQMLAITSGDMISKAGVWAHWGSWNFTRKYIHSNYNILSVEEMAQNLRVNVSEVQLLVKELQEIDRQVKVLNMNRNNLENQWLAPYPSYVDPFQCQYDTSQNQSLVNCNNQLLINLTNQENITTSGEILQGLDVSRVILPSIFGFNEFELNTKEELDLVIILDPQTNSAQILAAQYPLGSSMFTKLYYFNGLGTSRFDELKTVQTQTAGKVSMWNVNFNESDDLGIDFSEFITINETNSSRPK